ncbi:MAG: SPOR domain-containing protein [Terracidiphilus sp.]|jgi:cell division protein FtsN
MQGLFDEHEVEPVERRADTEVTLGSKMLLGLFFGLVLLCGLFFGLGYSIGSRSAHTPSTDAQQPGDQAPSQTSGSPAKPSAVSQITPPPLPPAANLSTSGVNPATTSLDTAATPARNPTPPIVKPALPAAAAAPAHKPVSAQPAPALKIAPTLPIMVQIATVSHQEDADVLVGALHKRGYAVAARRDPADDKYHVRVGPFSDRNDAIAMSQKLLRDGYNAVVQP